MRETEQDFVASSPRGCWCGALIEIEHQRTGQRQRVCAARTWIDSDSIADAA